MNLLRAVGLLGVLLLVLGVGSAVAVDVDGDGIATYQEFGETNPLVADTDDDDLDDGRERAFGADPTTPDTDGDGLTDGEEYWGTSGYEVGVDPETTPFDWERSDPTDVDTDGDGIEDGVEVDRQMDPTATDSDGDSLPDAREIAGPTDPTRADTDGDNLLDGWEVRGETDSGADISGADPLRKDAFVHVLYLEGADRDLSPGVFGQVAAWFAGMPVENPDGETGIDVHVASEQRLDRSIDVWVRDDGSTTAGVSGFMSMREFYNRETIGEKTGSHFLVVIAGEDVPVRGSGNAGGTKVSLIRKWTGSGETRYARIITHEMLHNMVRRIGGNDCNGKLHTCEGFLSYTDDTYLSSAATEKLNQNGFADPVYRDQMDAETCEDTIYEPELCD